MPARERDMTLAHVKEHSAATSPGTLTTPGDEEEDPVNGDFGDNDDDGDNDDEVSGSYYSGSELEDGKGKEQHVRRDAGDTVEDRIAKYNQSQFPMPIISIAEDPRDHTLVELAGRYRRMSLGEHSSKSTGEEDVGSTGSGRGIGAGVRRAEKRVTLK